MSDESTKVYGECRRYNIFKIPLICNIGVGSGRMRQPGITKLRSLCEHFMLHNLQYLLFTVDLNDRNVECTN